MMPKEHPEDPEFVSQIPFVDQRHKFDDWAASSIAQQVMIIASPPSALPRLDAVPDEERT